jgi:hypothetical protein
VVAWEDDQANEDALQASARGFENRFAEINLSDLSAGHQAAPDIGVAADGGFVAVWEDDTDLNGLYQVHARGFAPDGSERFARITLNSVATGQQRRPRVAVSPNGDFAVVWEDDPDGNGLYNLVGRGFYANGTQKWSDRDVALTGPGAELEPAIAMAGDGTFVVAWTDDLEHDGFFDVKARSFHANGTQRVAAFTVNSVAGGQQTQPDIAVTPNGEVVVVWADDSDVDWFRQIHARGFFNTGAQRFAAGRPVSRLRKLRQRKRGLHQLPQVQLPQSGHRCRRKSHRHRPRRRARLRFAVRRPAPLGQRRLGAAAAGLRRT